MTKDFCDICGNEIERKQDLRLVAMTNMFNGQPAMPSKETCVFCSEKIKNAIYDICMNRVPSTATLQLSTDQ